MFIFQLDEKIRMPSRGGITRLGEIYEGNRRVSAITLERVDGEFFIDTAFASARVNWGHPEKTVDEADVNRDLLKFCRFIEKYHDRFSSAA